MSSGTTAAARASAARTDNDRRMFGSLREIRAACQYLQNLIAAAAQGGAPAGAPNEVRAAVLDRVDQKIAPQLVAIHHMFDADAGQYEWCGDSLALIELTWSQVHDLWPRDEEAVPAASPRFQEISKTLDNIVYHCSSLSLSPRVNDVLCNLRVGQPLDLQFEFGNEFPADPDLRKRLVQELAQESGVLDCGIVDADQGVVYKTAPTRGAQLASSWHLLGWLLFGLIMPFLLSQGDRFLDGWPLHRSDLGRLLTDYFLILIGSGAHLAVEALKTAKGSAEGSFQAVDDWVLWVHVRENQLRRGIVYVWLGYILLVFGVPKIDWSSAFFAGYSIDSVTELFLQRFQTIVTTKTQALTGATAS